MRVITWNEDSCVRSYLCECGGMVGGVEDGVERQELLVQIAHRYNNFPKALEALKQEHDELADTYSTQLGIDHDEKTCVICKLIAELEEVK